MRARTERRAIRRAVDRLERRELLALVVLGKSIPAEVGSPFSGAVADLLDSNLAATPSDFTTPPGSVTITWDDEGTSPGSVIQLAPGVFEIDGTHTFQSPGSLSIDISAEDKAGNTAAGVGTATVAASPTPSPLQIAANSFKGVAGTPAPSTNPPTVATFIDPDTADSASDFNALISWGDGHSSPGKVTGTDGVFSVAGTNTYAAAGVFNFTVTVVGNGQTSSTTGQATIASPPQQYVLTGQPIVAAPGVPLTNATVVTFTDSTKTDSASIFTALISWGDGSSPTQGTVVATSGGFAIQGSHTYLNPGVYTIGAAFFDQSGHTASAMTTANVLNSNPVGAIANFTGTLAGAGNGPNAAGGFSNTNRPTFAGSAPPFAVVQLFAQRIDIDAVLPLGQAVASGTGQWTLPTGPLADGIYDVTAVVTPAGGYPGPAVPLTANNGQVVIDSTGPRLVAITPFGATGPVLVTLQAGFSGLNELSLLDPANYTFVGPRGLKIHPIAVTPLPAGSQPAGTQAVILVPSANPRLRRQITALSITGAGITDMAGNPLQDGSYRLSAAAALQARHPAVIKAVYHPKPRTHR